MDTRVVETDELPENVRAFFAAAIPPTRTIGQYVYRMEQQMGWTKWFLYADSATTKYIVAITTPSRS